MRRPLSPLLALVALAGCGQDYDFAEQKRVLSTGQATFDAGMVAVNDRETLDVLLYSTGQGGVTIYDIYVEDEEHWSVSPGWQAFDEDEDPTTLVLSGGTDQDPDTALFEVVFRPDAEGQFRTVLTIESNDNEVTERTEEGNRGIWKIVLRGIGRFPCGTIHPLFHDFGPRAAGGYFSKQATVENCGGVTLTIADFNPVGSTSFSVQSATPVYVVPGDSDIIEVAFVPGGGSPAAEALIEVVSNDPDLDAQTIDVVGNDCAASVDRAWDGDGDGWFPCAGDCDDDDSAVNPSAPERPSNGKDDDCDDLIDEPADGAGVDDDGDTFSENDGDCHDNDAAVYPGAPEALNGMDDDCDGKIDEGTDWYDDDGDTFSERSGDCDDGNNLIYPGAPESQNGIDDDCDGQIDEGFYTFDDDFDGFAEIEDGGEADCDDDDPWTYPGAEEDCDNRDNDCDGDIDEGADGAADGACAFLVDRQALDVEEGGCSATGGAAGALLALSGLMAVGRRRQRA